MKKKHALVVFLGAVRGSELCGRGPVVCYMLDLLLLDNKG